MKPRIASLLAGLALLPSLLAAAAPPFEVAEAGPPPAELSEALRSALETEGVRAAAGGATIEVWARREPPAAEPGAGKLGVAFDGIPEGALLGVLRLTAKWQDYKGQTIAPGLYTLRYSVQPADGYHMGVSLYRDFLLLAPAADDPDPAKGYGYDQLMAVSRKASGTNHPASLALFPAPEGARAPAAVSNEIGQPTLVLRIGGKLVGLVMEGVGEG
jgi:hypothetical protein